MAQVDTVVPNSLNYTDIKPQAIENKIQLVRYQPTSTINGAKGGDMIKFLLSGNGFLDPYSTYFQFKVTIPSLAQDEIRFLDRSAHSFITRMVIRSQGVELERIENYDVMAAMINDVIYSPEQCTQHYWEGFPTHQIDLGVGTYTQSQKYVARGDFPVGPSHVSSVAVAEREALFRLLLQGASANTHAYIGETAFHQYQAQEQLEAITVSHMVGEGEAAVLNTLTNFVALDSPIFIDHTLYREFAQAQAYTQEGGEPNQTSKSIDDIGIVMDAGVQRCLLYPLSFGFHRRGLRVPAALTVSQENFVKEGQTVKWANEQTIAPRQCTSMQFIIPIYSGVLGLLMPEKKLLPLNLLPLDIEIVFNQHALYSSHDTIGSRSYQISEFFLYGNTLFFEQEIHRTLEASVADHGLFIYCNSFHTAPQQLISTAQLPSTMYISMNLKSINSVHWVFLYSYYETKACARKLHFVSHNLKKMQLLNGTQLIPQYPIEGSSGTSENGDQHQFMLELYKSWNKMHDPTRDSALHASNMCGDGYDGQYDPLFREFDVLLTAKKEEGINFSSAAESHFALMQIINKQANVGRCQYGISLEGEELGSDRTMITGRKSQYPFQLQLWSEGKQSAHTSYMITFLRADFIIYIRPDLQIVTLGK